MTKARPRHFYLICATPRSGSTLLADALEATGLAGRPREYFDKGFEPFWCGKLGITSAADYFPKILEEGTTPNGVFGAKVLWYQTDHLADRLGDPTAFTSGTGDPLAGLFPDLRYVWITRRDVVRQAVSYCRAIKTDVWWTIRGEESKSVDACEHRDTFDFQAIDELVDLLRTYESNWERYFRERAIRPLRVTYEGMVRSYEMTIWSVLHGLGITTPADLALAEPRLVRQADSISEEWVARYLAVKQPSPVGH
jgi:LPS sulfotransferase NodH